jgi:two-component system, NarL family, invasion response regulator UvrY
MIAPLHPSIKLALVDDHKLFRKGLISLIEMVSTKFVILFEADNGLELQKKIDNNNLPDIVLMDVNMPLMDGFESVTWLQKNHPQIKVLVVSMIEKEETIVRMLKLGVKGYLCKDVEPHELGEALEAVASRGFYYTDFITGKLVHSLQHGQTEKKHQPSLDILNEREKDFLRLACTELTYAQIADKMFVSPKTVDGYRNSLFDKLQAKSRVGLAIFSIRNGLVILE